MRLKQVLMKTLLLSVFALFFWALPPTPTRADECGGDCSVVPCNFETVCDDETGDCLEVHDWCSACGGNGCDNVGCPPGQYMANDGCHDIGEGGDGGGGGGIVLASCPSGTQPTGGVMYLPGTADMSCMAPIGCNQFFPVRHSGNPECSGSSQGSCEVAQLCCAPGQAVECGGIVSTDEVLSTDVKWDGYSRCPVGTRVAGTFFLDSPSVYCRQNCSCVTPCGTRPGTTVSCQDVSMGTYEIQTFLHPTVCYNWLDSRTADDRYVSHRDSNIVYARYKDENGEWVTEYYKITTCERINRVCTCNQTCTSTAPTNLSVTQGASGTAATLSWRSGTGGTSQVVYVGSNQNSVNNDCAYGGCIISDVALSPFYANYNFSYPVTGLTPNTTYYFRVVTQENSSCRPSAIFDASIDIY